MQYAALQPSPLNYHPQILFNLIKILLWSFIINNCFFSLDYIFFRFFFYVCLKATFFSTSYVCYVTWLWFVDNSKAELNKKWWKDVQNFVCMKVFSFLSLKSPEIFFFQGETANKNIFVCRSFLHKKTYLLKKGKAIDFPLNKEFLLRLRRNQREMSVGNKIYTTKHYSEKKDIA